MTAGCPQCLNGCGGARTDCPQRAGGPIQRPARGRPSSYTDDLAGAICDRLAQGETLSGICQREDMPSTSMVYRWLSTNPDFRDQYVHAREQQAHAIAEKALREAEAAADAQLGRLAFDARKWFASKVAPRVYGDKITQEHTGPGGGPVEIKEIRRVIVDPKGGA